MFGLLIILLLICLAPNAAAEVFATRLDGTAAVGELRGWDEKEVLVATAAGDERITTDQLISLRWATAPEEQNAESITTPAQIEMVDGSQLPIDEFQTVGSEALAVLTGPLASDEKLLRLPRKQLAAVQLQPLDAAAAAQWDEIRDLDMASDVLVLLKRNGESLDYVEGALGDVSSSRIEFKLDGEPVRIDREKVAGFLYYRAKGQPGAEPRSRIHGFSGLRVNVSRAQLSDRMVQMTLAGGAKLNWPIDDLFLADFSAGKLLYLSDIDPASERWTPLVGLPSGATLAAEFGEPRRNQSAYGGPLTLSLAEPMSASPVGDTRHFNKGLAVRSRTELVYRLPAGFRGFTAIAGIDPATSASGDVRLEIYGDDRLLLSTHIAGNDPPCPIDLEVGDVKRLKIVVDYGRNLDTGDWLNLCDARIVK